MSVRPTLLKDLRRTAITNHQHHTGTGNYNRFSALAPDPPQRNRTYSQGKRQLSQDEFCILQDPPKTPRMDSNVVFAQLKEQDALLAEAKTLLEVAAKTGEDCFSATDGGLGTAFSSLTKVLAIVLKSQENLTSALVDSVKVTSYPKNNSHAYTTNPTPAATIPLQPPPRGRTNSFRNTAKVPVPELAPEEMARRKVKQVLREAEKKSLLFNLDLGTAPTMNKDTLSRKVTMALIGKASEGKHDYHIGDAEDVIDDILSCTKLEFLGSTTRKFYNNRDKKDPRNGKMCTLPVRMDFKDRDTRIQAEINMRQICQVSCSTPYPKRLRTMLSELVVRGKLDSPENFIRTRVNIDKLTIDAQAKVKGTWVDLGLQRDIPLDILDRVFTEPIKKSTTDSTTDNTEEMEEEESISLS